jgi:glutathionylspermidine synthase
MLRKNTKRRQNFRHTHDKMGFVYDVTSSADGEPYWREDVAYEFTLEEVEAIEAVTEELHSMCLETVDEIVKSGDYPEQFNFSDATKYLIEQSWKTKEVHIYGRFDFMYESPKNIKMYEYNADTPTSLLEASVAQWEWLQEVRPDADQFNSIHEKLVARWASLVQEEPDTMYFLASIEAGYEDWGNLQYMADTALQGGWNIHIEEIEQLGYDSIQNEYVDRNHETIHNAFKLYPLEWLVDDAFGKHLIDRKVRWFEPEWKMLLSNKGILPILWQRYQGHPNLLPSFFEEFNGSIKKPLLGREGSNLFRAGKLIEGAVFHEEYDTAYIYQEYSPLPEIDGFYPVVGSWVVGDESAGMGIREDLSIISGNGSHFVPHYFVD